MYDSMIHFCSTVLKETRLELTFSWRPIMPLVGNNTIITEKCNFRKIYIPVVCLLGFGWLVLFLRINCTEVKSFKARTSIVSY